MKKIAIATTLSIGLLLSGCTQGNPVVIETSAGDITKDDYINKLEELYQVQAIGELVVEKVLREKYKATDEEVDAEIKSTYESQGFTDLAQFKQELELSGQTLEEFKERIYVSLLFKKAQLDGVSITEADLEKEYEKSKKELRASHILVATKEEADAISKELKDGAEFEKLATEKSTDTVSAAAGGDLDFFSAGDMDYQFENAAYALEIGEVSEPVQSSFGYHIIKVTDSRDVENLESYEALKATLKQNLELRLALPSEEVVNNLMKEANPKAKDKELKEVVDSLTLQLQ